MIIDVEADHLVGHPEKHIAALGKAGMGPGPCRIIHHTLGSVDQKPGMRAGPVAVAHDGEQGHRRGLIRYEGGGRDFGIGRIFDIHPAAGGQGQGRGETKGEAAHSHDQAFTRAMKIRIPMEIQAPHVTIRIKPSKAFSCGLVSMLPCSCSAIVILRVWSVGLHLAADAVAVTGVRGAFVGASQGGAALGKVLAHRYVGPSYWWPVRCTAKP